MSISETQREAITSVLRPYGQVFLYGSRVNDTLKGGDIDLLLVVSPVNQARIGKSKYALLAQIEKKIGEQKLDLTIATPELLSTDPFLKQIALQMIALS